MRYVYERKSGAIEMTAFDKDGKVNYRTLSKIDEKGNETESVSPDSPMQGWTSVYTYKYQEFDAAGNWTKRTMTYSRISPGKTPKEIWTQVEYRTINYY